MTFRSPPPHRRSSGSKGGDDFTRIQRDLQAMVREIGFHSLPLNDDSLRPFMDFLWDFSKAHDQLIYSFDDGKGERIFHGFRGPLVPLNALRAKMDRELFEKFTPDDVKRARPTFSIGAVSWLYLAGVWTPAAALASRRH